MNGEVEGIFWKNNHKQVFLKLRPYQPDVELKQLLIRLKNADDLAFRELFELYVKKVYQFVFRHIKDKSEAEDITQNVFIRIWEKKQLIDPDRSFEGFIFSIAYRFLIDHYRSTSNRFKVDSMDRLPETDLQSTMHSDELVRKHQLESLYQQALSALPPRRKEIFLESRHNGLTNREIAQKLGISVKTVESQMTSALAFLRDFFDRTEMGPTALLGIYFFLG